MSSEACVRSRIERDEAPGLRVRDVMDGDPKTQPASLTVAQLRAEFDGDFHHRMALLTDGAVLLGAVERSDLPADAPGDGPASAFARRPANVIGPEEPAVEAIEQLDADGVSRLVVLADDGQTLLGLVCMDAARSHFCVARRPERIA
jgi:CBS-domain-containing membrane protein